MHLTQSVQRKSMHSSSKGCGGFYGENLHSSTVTAQMSSSCEERPKSVANILNFSLTSFGANVPNLYDVFKELLKRITCQPNSANAHRITRRRVRGPRPQWRHHTHKYIWNQYESQGEFVDSVEQNQRIQQFALSRVFFQPSSFAGLRMLQHPWRTKESIGSRCLLCVWVAIFLLKDISVSKMFRAHISICSWLSGNDLVRWLASRLPCGSSTLCFSRCAAAKVSKFEDSFGCVWKWGKL